MLPTVVVTLSKIENKHNAWFSPARLGRFLLARPLLVPYRVRRCKSVAPFVTIACLLLPSLVDSVALCDALVMTSPLQVGVWRQREHTLDGLADLDVPPTIILGPDREHILT